MNILKRIFRTTSQIQRIHWLDSFARPLRRRLERIFLRGELGGNDDRYFARVGVPVVCFGPLREECRFHGVDEFVYLSDIQLVSRTLVNLIEDWNSEER